MTFICKIKIIICLQIRICIFKGRPYLEKVEGDGLEGNAQFEGYSMDLIDAVSKDLGFKYEFKIVKGNEYGSLNKETKQWTGLIREIQDKVIY